MSTPGLGAKARVGAAARARVARVAALALCMLATGGCSSPPATPLAAPPAAPPGPGVVFEAHASQRLQQVLSRRQPARPDLQAWVALNAPAEWRPAGPPRGGVLLVHGLGDSAWSFHDLGPVLAAQGFLVRSVLLPGHGTRPDDLLAVTLEDWQQTVREQAEQLQREAGPVWLGGFSTGANLVLDQARRQADVAGLLLFSPAFRASVPFGWITPWLRHVRPWLIEPDPALETVPVRYGMVPTNAFAQFHRSSTLAQQHLADAPVTQPALLVLAAHDSVVDTQHAWATFRARFTHPGSRLIWYGAPPEAAALEPRLRVRPDALPDWRISQFSHMGVLFSPDNPLYGVHGRLRLCRNSNDAAATRACEQGGELWFSEWGHQAPGKRHARLTFNPYFDWQAQVMASVMGVAEEPLMMDASMPSPPSSHTTPTAPSGQAAALD